MSNPPLWDDSESDNQEHLGHVDVATEGII